MFDVIRKSAYWSALDNTEVFEKLGGKSLNVLDSLKHIQDAWTLQRLVSLKGARILEIGGGLSRILPVLDSTNERWNLDEFRGDGNGITRVPVMPHVRLVRKKMGDFAPELPDGYFDIVFSVSVIEHIPTPALAQFWKDHARVLKPGGMAYHAIDLYVSERPNPAVQSRLHLYRTLPPACGLKIITPDSIPSPLVFQCDMASNSDWCMWRWNKAAPSLADVRASSQSISLGLELAKA